MRAGGDQASALSKLTHHPTDCIQRFLQYIVEKRKSPSARGIAWGLNRSTVSVAARAYVYISNVI